MKGITDQKSIDDWEVPFTIDYSLIEPADDKYWEDYGTTPKAFVSLATGRRLWGSRFGQSTSYRIPAREGLTEEAVQSQLLEQLAGADERLGFDFQPIKRRQLMASAGNTPFDVLFSDVELLHHCRRLVAGRLAVSTGIRTASPPGRPVAGGRLASPSRSPPVGGGGTGISAVGSALGVLIGLGYAALILAALRSKSWWLGAVTTPFLEFHVTPRSLLIGGLAGMLVSGLTIAWSVYQTRHIPARRLLTGQLSVVGSWVARPARWPLIVAGLCCSSPPWHWPSPPCRSPASSRRAPSSGPAPRCSRRSCSAPGRRCDREAVASQRITGRLPLLRLAVRSAARNPGRSTLTIALIATASFLIVAMSAFQLQPTETGTGGFTLVGESSQPIYSDLNSESGRDELLGDRAAQLADVDVCALRVRPGDDASCGNLYRASQPRILGVPPAFVRRFDGTSTGGVQVHQVGRHQRIATPQSVAAPGRGPTPVGEPIPVVIDQETAMYSLQLYQGIGEEFTFDYDGRPITVPRGGASFAEHPAWQSADLRSRFSSPVSHHQRISLFPDRDTGERVRPSGRRVGGWAGRPGVRRDGQPLASWPA